MKLKYLLLGGFAALLASCSQKQCHIEGIVENAMDGDTLYIARMTDGNLTPSDTILLKDGKFSMQETCDSTIIACFYYYNRQTDEVYSSLFFMEDGTVNLQVRPNCKISGTENNDIYQHFMDSIYSIHEQMSKIYASFDIENMEEADLEAIPESKEMAELEKKNNELVMSTVRKHIGTSAGFVLFLSCYNIFEPNEVLQLIEKVSPHYKNNGILSLVRKEAENNLSTADRTQFIDVTIPAIDGGDLRLSDIVKANKLTMIDCWASWCGPCRAEMPNIVGIYKKFHSKGFEIVGISFDDDEDAWKKAVENMNMTWPQCSELNSWDNVMTQKYGVGSIPYTILIDNDGNILAQQLRGKALEKFIEDYLQ